MRNRLFICGLFFAAFSFAMAPNLAVAETLPVPDFLNPPPIKARFDPSLLASLRKGGYLLFVRHTATAQQPGFDGSPGFRPDDFANCATQRNLSKDGRDQAAKLGIAFRALEIPLGFIHASPYCRTRDTAWLAFGRVTLDRRLLLNSSNPDLDPDEANHWRDIRLAVKAQPMIGTNSVFVSHAGIATVLGGPLLAEGETAIIDPTPATGPKIIATIKLDGWIDAE